MDGIDFQQLEALAKSDPQAFEVKRRELIEELFASIEARSDDPQFMRRLRGLQFTIDMERRRSPDGMRALLRIYSMMWDSFIEFDDLLQRLTRSQRALAPAQQTARSAQIIPFHRAE